MGEELDDQSVSTHFQQELIYGELGLGFFLSTGTNLDTSYEWHSLFIIQQITSEDLYNGV